MEETVDQLILFGIGLGALVLVCGLIVGAHYLLLRLFRRHPDRQHIRQLILGGFALLVTISALLALPVADATRGQMIVALGLFFGAALALSAGKPVGNLLAGISFRAANPCGAGDYIKVGEYAGRIVRIDLMGIELQTAGNELIHVPSLYLLSNPASVAAGQRDVIALTMPFSLNTPRQQAEELLLWAAGEAGLRDAVVEVTELAGGTVTYTIAGRVEHIRDYTATELALRTRVLDAVQSAGANLAPAAFVAGGAEQPAAADISPEFIERKQQAEAEVERRSTELKALKKDYTEMSQRLIALERELQEAGPTDEAQPLRLEKKKLEARLLRCEKDIKKAEAALRAA